MKAILICSHGSRDPRDNTMVLGHAEKIAEETGLTVRTGYMKHQEPTVMDVLSGLAADGHDEVVIVPMLYAEGRLTERDLPAILGIPEGSREGTVTTPSGDVSVRITGAFGDHPSMTAVMEAAVSGHPADTTTVVLVGHGSKGPGNSRTVEYDAVILRAMGYTVVCAYNEMQDPTVEAALETALSSGRPRVLVIPMFVSPNGHSRVDIPGKLGIGDGAGRVFDTPDGHVELLYGAEIGTHPGVGRILLERASE